MNIAKQDLIDNYEGPATMIDRECSIGPSEGLIGSSSRADSNPAVMLVACAATMYGFAVGLVIGLVF